MVEQCRIISLVGMPGSGKSTLGRRLARIIGWKFLDSDALVEAQTGLTVSAIFSKQGEKTFRDLETNILNEVVNEERVIFATGGGLVLRSFNRDALRKNTYIVYLHVQPSDLSRRLSRDTSRPLLQGYELAARLQALYDERDKLYRDIAHMVMDVTSSSAEVLASMVVKRLQAAAVISQQTL